MRRNLVNGHGHEWKNHVRANDAQLHVSTSLCQKTKTSFPGVLSGVKTKDVLHHTKIELCTYCVVESSRVRQKNATRSDSRTPRN